MRGLTASPRRSLRSSSEKRVSIDTSPPRRHSLLSASSDEHVTSLSASSSSSASIISPLQSEAALLLASGALGVGSTLAQRRQQLKSELFDRLVLLEADAAVLDCSHSTPLMYAIEACNDDLAMRLLELDAYRHTTVERFSLTELINQV
jgi:ankyrin repeat protein